MLRKPSHVLSAIAVTAACSSFLASAQAQAPVGDSTLKLNQIQVIGTHSSYHAGIASNESKLWQGKYAKAYEGLDYQHQPLPQQFDSGVQIAVLARLQEVNTVC
jgi:Phosphoinositide phospholipase C, Ca2+-dependent